MLDGGYIHPRNEHTKPAGIWRKLQTLYNLEALDEREDARQLDKMELDEDEQAGSEAEEEDEDVYSEAANKIENEDFELPGAEWEALKWAHRLASEKQKRDESPPVLPELNMAEQPPMRFTPSFSIEPSDVATPKGRGRARTSTMTRGKPATARTRKSTRKSESVAPVDDEQQEEVAVEEEVEESGEGEEASERSTPAVRSTRSRGRPSSQTRRHGRSRGK